jgi:anaphase-promoting complex subunit 5
MVFLFCSLGKSYSGEGICQSLCSLALWLSLQGEYNLSVSILHHAKERFPRYPTAKYWMICDTYITSIQAILRGRWHEANESCAKMHILDATLSVLQRASLNLARGNINLAQKFITDLLQQEETKDKPLEVLNKVRALILLANTLIVGKKFSPEIVEVLNQALNLAKGNHLLYETATIDVLYAYLLLLMGMPKQALKSMNISLEVILENGGLYDKAKTVFLFVKCLLSASPTSVEKLKKLNQCLPLLNDCFEQFMKLECYSKAKDIYYFLAVFYDQQEMFDERNNFAFKFRVLDEQYPTSSEYLDTFY